MTQPLPIKDQLKALERLQELDLKIDRLKAKKDSIPVALKGLDEQFGKARLAVETKKKAIDELEKVKRQAEGARDLNGDRMTRANGKLESVAKGEHYSAATKEIDQLKKAGASIDEQIKRAGADIAAANTELATLTATMDKAQQERDAQAGVLAGETGNLDQEITKLASERGQFTPSVEKRILSIYDRVRVARGGLGLVPALGGRCKGCNMVVPPQIYNEVQRGSTFHSCPSCHRILFIPGPGGGADAPAPEAQK